MYLFAQNQLGIVRVGARESLAIGFLSNAGTNPSQKIIVPLGVIFFSVGLYSPM